MLAEVPKGWRRIRFGDIFRERKEAGWPGLPVASVSIEGGLVLRSSMDRRVESNLSEEDHSLVRRSDIAYNTMRMWQGASGIARTDCCVSPAYVVMTPLPSLDPEFAALMLRAPHVVRLLHGYSQGIVDDRLRLYPKDFLRIPVNLPPLEEQRQIAVVLRSADDTIKAADEAVEQAIIARDRKLETLFAQHGDMKKIVQVCRLSGGYGFPLQAQGKQSGEYPFAKVSDMNLPGNEIEMVTAVNYIDDDDLKPLRAKTFPPGTTFFPKVGAAVLTNKRRIAATDMVVDNNIMAAVPADIDPWYLYFAFCTIDMADYVQPGALPSINQTTVGNIAIPVPSRAAQHKFVESMRSADATITAQRVVLEHVRRVKSALASELLSGRHRIGA